MGSKAQEIGELSVKLADAAMVALQRGDTVQAIFFSTKAAETLVLAKALGWTPTTAALTDSPPPQTDQHQ